MSIRERLQSVRQTGLSEQNQPLPVVLHDIPNGAVRNLESFLRKLRDEGHLFTQDFPHDCTPILNGRVLQSLDEFC